MKGKELKLSTNKRKFFRQYLELVKIFKPFTILRPKELDVLAEFMYLNDQYSNIPYEDRWKLIMHYDTKVAVKERLSMGDANFNNILSAFRNKGIMIDKRIEEKYLFTIGDNFEFKINFKID